MNNKKEHICTICLSEIEADIYYLPCSHLFHEKCIFMWLKEKPTCPTCRIPIDAQVDEKGNIISRYNQQSSLNNVLGTIFRSRRLNPIYPLVSISSISQNSGLTSDPNTSHIPTISQLEALHNQPQDQALVSNRNLVQSALSNLFNEIFLPAINNIANSSSAIPENQSVISPD